jgi:hypothetical protein
LEAISFKSADSVEAAAVPALLEVGVELEAEAVPEARAELEVGIALEA